MIRKLTKNKQLSFLDLDYLDLILNHYIIFVYKLVGSSPIAITTTKANNRKRPLEDITSRSQQNKWLNSFGRDVQKAVDELIIKHKLTNSSGEPIVDICHIDLNYKENQACIKFKDSNPTATQTKLDAVIWVCDEALLGRDGYRHLAAIVPILFREYLVTDRRNRINELINVQIPIETFNLDIKINNQFSFDDRANLFNVPRVSYYLAHPHVIANRSADHQKKV